LEAKLALVLIADDSSFQRKVLAGALAKAGYETLEAANGKDGIEKALTSEPACILMDILMPDLDGVSALQELRARGNKAPVIMVTADIQETTRKKCMNLGAVGFVNKPVKGPSLDNLLNIVKCYVP